MDGSKRVGTRRGRACAPVFVRTGNRKVDMFLRANIRTVRSVRVRGVDRAPEVAGQYYEAAVRTNGGPLTGR